MRKITVPFSIFITTRFPERATPTGQEISKYLNYETDIDDTKLHRLFSENRYELKDTILRNLHAGRDVIADRYSFSGVAYSVAKGLDLETCKSTEMKLPAPDIVFFLDIDPTVAANRSDYGKERYEKVGFQIKVREAFNSLISPSWVILDAKKPQEELHKIILAKVENYSRSKPIQLMWY